jgi:hypothetical protein
VERDQVKRHLLIKQTLGEFIPGPDGGSYKIVDVPRPAQVSHRRTTDDLSGSMHEAVDITCACPNCLHEVAFTFPVANATRSFVQEFQYQYERDYKRTQEWHEQRDPKRHEKVTAMYLEALEEWS